MWLTILLRYHSSGSLLSYLWRIHAYIILEEANRQGLVRSAESDDQILESQIGPAGSGTPNPVGPVHAEGLRDGRTGYIRSSTKH